MAKRGGVAAKNYVLHIFANEDDSSEKTLCGRFCKDVNCAMPGCNPKPSNPDDAEQFCHACLKKWRKTFEKPIEDDSGFKNADKVEKGPVVRINGVAFQSYLVDDIQRLPSNEYLKALVKRNVCPYSEGAVIDLNKLCVLAQEDEDVRRARNWLHLRIGYSLCGYADVYPEAKIENPFWEESNAKDQD